MELTIVIRKTTITPAQTGVCQMRLVISCMKGLEIRKCQCQVSIELISDSLKTQHFVTYKIVLSYGYKTTIK